MNVPAQTFSREYLQGVQEQRKQEAIERVYSGFITYLLNHAAVGRTSYLYQYNELPSINCYPTPGIELQQPPTITNEDMVEAFQKKFPGCIISYQEKWDEKVPGLRRLHKGILIDWL